MIRIGTAQADQLHSTGRTVFENITRHVAEMKAEGTDESLIVGRFVTELGATVLGSLRNSGDEQFWDDLWQLLAALGYAAVSAGESKTVESTE